MEPMRVTLGAPGRIMPPASKAVEFAQQAEADGFDAIWWPCHLMGWTPDSVWTEDLTALAKYQPNPHMYFEPLMMMGAAGAATERIKVGVCVTDTIRRHPAMLAQEARLVARIRHLNVVPTLDVLEVDGEVFIIMEFVKGVSFAKLLDLTYARDGLVPLAIVSSILAGALRGLHAAQCCAVTPGNTGQALAMFRFACFAQAQKAGYGYHDRRWCRHRGLLAFRSWGGVTPAWPRRDAGFCSCIGLVGSGSNQRV